MKKFFCSIFIIMSLTSCINNYEKRGYAFELADDHLLQEGVTSKENVIKIMGSPTIISDLSSDESWIYYSEEVKKVLFFLPKVVERKVLVIKFDDLDSIRTIEKFDLSNGESKMKFVEQYTEVKSHNVGFFKSLFSNIGQIKPQ
ncbi:MAG: outer membrane protein assembly factor BamE [Pelagibacterales bacterium]|nr:outer membrane protein assembly factor BamE [Pelagibacterales bacterium]